MRTMITVRCSCGETFQADDAHIGKAIRCRCGRILEIKQASVPAPSRRPEVAARTQRAHQVESAPVRGRRVRGRRGTVLGAGVLSVLGVVLLLWWSSRTDIDEPSASPVTTAPETTFASPEAPSPVGARPPLADATDPHCWPGNLVRPGSSVELGREYRGGLGRLQIANGTAFDAVAVLLTSQTARPRRAIYIRKQETGVITEIPPGTYQLQFQLGVDWPRHGTSFCQVHATSEFDRPLAFTERPSDDGQYYSAFEVTLHPVPEGTATTHEIPRSAFRLPPP